ncbi:hypothetical protein [Thermoanaerobacterium thermosaccharolyticum]|uniref:hypothetical protein n=1 Tax=Thermoanaerobacterium thermosaccharolyticum TaxID=1517 RepID=UPI00177BD42A|nr:hypothetical protein [Thermoanaerobacterium thermosaccharolyticum]MBE0069925.1 hypothetical protein [Thermoanaerobacterium thermosaccharolyticum]MBE0228053.1 hypothetical protein [Thermoanaerobacterium thermosaccharolyticum]
MIKFVKWVSGKIRGTVGVKLDEIDILKVITLSGNDLPVDFLLSILDAALGEDWKNKAEEMFLSRGYSWKVKVTTGMSGRSDYFLIEKINEEFNYSPVTAHIHISMSGTLNEGIYIHLSKLPPLLNKILEDCVSCNPSYLKVIVPREEGPFNEPSTPSGLLETVDAIKSIKVLSGND